MTKKAMETISGDVVQIIKKLEVLTKEIDTVEDMKHAHKDLKVTMMEIAKSFGDF
jgi:hypothetical protein